MQAYHDHYDRDSQLSGESVSTWDLDFQHRRDLHEHLDILWGLGYRHQAIDLEERFTVQFDRRDRHLDTFSSFVQGDLNITDELVLTLGSKFEHNDFTGFEYQPNARVHWQITEDHNLWASVSRAVRTPNIVDDDARNNFSVFTQPGFPPILFQLVGNPELEAEELIAYEAGWRGQLRPNLSLDVAAFYNDYDKLVSAEFDPIPEFRTDPVPHLLFRSRTDNQLRGETYGVEVNVEWQATDRWRLTGSYTFLAMDLEARSGSSDLFSASFIEGSNPEQQFQVHSYLNLPYDIEFDTHVYWVDRLPGATIEGFPSPVVDDYLRLDLHLGWRPAPGLQLGLFAQNLLENRHTETAPSPFIASEIPRGIFGRVRWTWE